MSQEKLYGVFRCYGDSELRDELGYYLSPEDPKNILIKSIIGIKTKELLDNKDDLSKFVAKYIGTCGDKTDFKTEKELLDIIEKRGTEFLWKLYFDTMSKEITISYGDDVGCDYIIEYPPGSHGSIYSGGCYFGIAVLEEWDTKTLKIIDDNINQYLHITDETK